MEEGLDACQLTELVEQHYQLLYRFAYRLSGSAADAEDLTQQTFLSAQKNLHQLRETEYAKSWLLTIVRNTFLKSIRGRKNSPTISLEKVQDPAVIPQEEPDFDQTELQNALNELPVDFRVPLVLFYFDDFSYKEIAAQLELPIGTIMSRLARAKSQLKALLEQKSENSTQSTVPTSPTDS